MASQEISFSKISYNRIKLTQGSKNFQEYGARMGKTDFKDICGKIDYSHKKIYSNGDITLGGYVILLAANYERVCKEC